jgi:hypothetical protein
MYLEVLHYLLTNSEYPQHIHRRSEISSFLLGLIKVSLSQPLFRSCVVLLTSHVARCKVEDDQTLGPLALKASTIFEECPFLQAS